MGWKTVTPMSIEELHQALVQLHENKQYVKEVTVDHNNRLLKVDLTWLANTQMQDFMIPLRQGTTNEVDDLVRVMLGESERGLIPSRGVSERLFQYIDSARR